MHAHSHERSSVEYQRISSNILPFDSEIQPPSEPSEYAFKFIRLNPGITQRNFICCLFHYMLMLFGLVGPGVLQPLILLDKDYFAINTDHAGTLTSALIVAQLVVKIIVSIPYGHYSDKLGRKTMIYYGAINIFLGCVLVPIQTSVFPGFLLTKILVSNGATAISTVPLLADYVADESKGKAAGLLAMCMSFSAAISNIFLKILFNNHVSLGKCYTIVGVFTLCAMVLNTFGLKGGHYYAEKKKEFDVHTDSLVDTFREVLQIFYSNGWLMITLVIQVLGSSDFMVFFTFLTLYVRSLFPEDTPSTTINIVVNGLQTLILVPSFFGNICYGYLLDRKKQAIPVTLFALAGGALSFVFIASTQTPYDWSIKFGSMLMGTTLPGLYVISSYLGIKNFPPEKRGIMIGFTGMVAYTGFFIIATGGGFLFDNWRRDGPFIICCGLLVVALIGVLRIKKVYSL